MSHVGILMSNLGTPDAPTRKALKIYLREFLWDPRVIDGIARWKWWLLLNGIVLRTRPQRSAKLYASIWTKDGSPLLVTTQRQGMLLEEQLRQRCDTEIHVAVGMRYGTPGIRQALESLRARQCQRILLLPMYPQYCCATTGSTFDAVAKNFSRWRAIPEFRWVRDYFCHPGYIAALAKSVRELWDEQGPPEKLVLSFHGIPQRFTDEGDPYYGQCLATAQALTQKLDMSQDQWCVTFQSRFGKEAWIQPYTDETLVALANGGVRHVDVICPGFSADCLETIEEIERENRKHFMQAGGKTYRYIPALNDRQDHIEMLCQVVMDALYG